MFFIYCHTNKLNGKRYVGQTVVTMEKRWKQHVSAAKRRTGSCRLFEAAIRKYGADAFNHEVLETVDSQKDADAAETKWIASLNTRSPNGYNLASGGDGVGHHHEDSKRLIGESSKKRWDSASSESRLEHGRKCQESISEEGRASQSEKMRVWQIAQAELRTPEQRSAIVKKAAETIGKEGLRERGLKSLETRRRNGETGADVRERLSKGLEIARARGVRTGRRPTVVTPEVFEKLTSMRAAGISVPKIASELNVSASALHQAIHRRLPKLTPEQLRTIKRQGWANMTPEARDERVRGLKEGRRKESSLTERQPSMCFNLLAPRAA